MPSIKDLNDFIDKAERSRKYPTSSAQGLKAAVKLFDTELNDEERASLDLFEQNIDQIYQSVFNKNKNLTVSSLATYKSRVLKAISDYKKYGTDATKMSNWQPKVVTRAKRSGPKRDEVPTANDAPVGLQNNELAVPDGMTKLELALRPDMKFVLVVPYDLRASEVVTIKSILDSLSSNNEQPTSKDMKDAQE